LRNVRTSTKAEASKRCPKCPNWFRKPSEASRSANPFDVASCERAEDIKRAMEAGEKEVVIEIPAIPEAITRSLADAEHGRRLQTGTLKKYRVLLAQVKDYADSEGARSSVKNWNGSELSAGSGLRQA